MNLTGLFLTILALIVANLLLFTLLYAYYRSEKRKLVNVIRAYFEPLGEGKPSQFAEVTGAISQQFASSLLQTMKASTMGSSSVESKHMARAEQALMGDLLTQANPIMGFIAQQFPALVKIAHKNPAAAQLLASFVKQRPASNNSEDEPQYQLDIK